MRQKLQDLMTQVKALKNTGTGLTNILALKHNATLAVGMAVDLIGDLIDAVEKLEEKTGGKHG